MTLIEDFLRKYPPIWTKEEAQSFALLAPEDALRTVLREVQKWDKENKIKELCGNISESKDPSVERRCMENLLMHGESARLFYSLFYQREILRSFLETIASHLKPDQISYLLNKWSNGLKSSIERDKIFALDLAKNGGPTEIINKQIQERQARLEALQACLQFIQT